MITFYSSGGSQEIGLVQPLSAGDGWAAARGTAYRLLRAEGHTRAAELLLGTPFELWAGTNSFGDDFDVLYAELPLEQYLVLAALERDEATHRHFRQVARALEVARQHVRFIAVALSRDVDPGMVAAPSPALASETLERALSDVQRALADGRPADGVDRVHTALHAYLRGLAESHGQVLGDAGIVELLRTLRQSHPALQASGPRAADITRVLNALATIVDALNPIRNRASLAHPAEVLAEAEAMLVINAVRTLLHYLESRLRLHSARG